MGFQLRHHRQRLRPDGHGRARRRRADPQGSRRGRRQVRACGSPTPRCPTAARTTSRSREGGSPPSSRPRQTGDLDLEARCVLPPLVDGHIHLDKTLLGLPWVPNQAAGNQRRRPHRGRAQGARGAHRSRDRRPAPTWCARSWPAARCTCAAMSTSTTSSASRTSTSPEGPRALPRPRRPSRSSPSRKAASCARPGTAELLDAAHRRRAPTLWAASTRSASTATSTAISTRSSPSPSGAASASTSICTTAAKAASPRSCAIAERTRGRRPAGQGRGQPCLRAGLGADRTRRPHGRPAGRGRRRDHEPRPGRRHRCRRYKLLREHGVRCSAAPTISAMPGRPSATATCWSAP